MPCIRRFRFYKIHINTLYYITFFLEVIRFRDQTPPSSFCLDYYQPYTHFQYQGHLVLLPLHDNYAIFYNSPHCFLSGGVRFEQPCGAAQKYRRGVGSGLRTKEVSPQLKANVSAQIDKWLRDIESVNNFIDTISSITNPVVISSMAATAFIAAQNEGASNTILQQDVKLDASGQAAAQALIGKFSIIGPAFNDTISNPGNLQKNLDAINGARYSYLIWSYIGALFRLTV